MEAEPGFWQQGWSNETLARGIDSAGGMAFIWEDSNEIIGFVCAHDVGFRAYLSELIVAQQMRGRGVGKGLLERVQTSLAQRGCATLIADVWHEAVPFYRYTYGNLQTAGFAGTDANLPTGAGQRQFHTAGVAIFPSPKLVLKATYQRVIDKSVVGALSDSFLGGVGFFF